MKNLRSIKKYPCPCCGYLTRSAQEFGTFDICEICSWEDDYVQFKDPDYQGGANKVSLNQARENYKKFGAESEKSLKRIRRPKPDEIPNKLS